MERGKIVILPCVPCLSSKPPCHLMSARPQKKTSFSPSTEHDSKTWAILSTSPTQAQTVPVRPAPSAALRSASHEVGALTDDHQRQDVRRMSGQERQVSMHANTTHAPHAHTVLGRRRDPKNIAPSRASPVQPSLRKVDDPRLAVGSPPLRAPPRPLHHAGLCSSPRLDFLAKGTNSVYAPRHAYVRRCCPSPGLVIRQRARAGCILPQKEPVPARRGRQPVGCPRALGRAGPLFPVPVRLRYAHAG